MTNPVVVSYSEIFKWQTCRRQYYYRFIMGLKPIEESDAIQTGVKGHQLLQNFYELLGMGHSKDEAHMLTTKSAMKLLNGKGLVDSNLIKAWTLVDNYIRDNDFTAKAVLIENRFLLPVASFYDDPSLSNVQIGFTPDVVFERNGRKIDVEDAKFVARAWSKSKKNRFQQIKLYQIFLECMGYDISRNVLRFFNVTTGEISVQNYTMSKEEERTLIHDFMEGVTEVVKFKTQAPEIIEKAARTMNYTACQFCQFEYPCTLQAEGKDATNTLNTQFTKSDYDYLR